jgi:GTP pyrophosphokinase
MDTLDPVGTAPRQAVADAAPPRALARLLDGRGTHEQAVIRRAYDIARHAHEGQTRRSGEPYLSHPLAVAGILNDLRMDHETLAAALLHDVIEDTAVDLVRLHEETGATVAALVEGVTKMEAIDDYTGGARAGDERQQVERLKKLLLAIASDVRVVLIKLADRLHNMRTLRHLDEASRQRIARETMEIYAPLAGRLGIAQFRWEMEDLAFRELEPKTYMSIARQLDERRTDREAYISRVVATLERKLEEQGVRAEVRGRVKHIHSIWGKMQRKELGFDQIFDVRAVRILVDDVAACYAALGVVHTLWKHVAQEFDDYIANPKSNRYQSLHTAVIGPDGKTVEAQIRTHQMHQHAEYGVAAHWRYKEGEGAGEQDPNARTGWLRQILEVKDESEGPRDFLDRFNAELFSDRVYAVTPQGQVLDLPAGATPLDFAYQVHTDLGHRCRGAKINGQMVPLTTLLRSGDQVEILTTRNGTPSRDWLSPHLGYLNTARARAKVRHWFKHRDHDKNVAAGQDTLQRELRRLGIASVDRERLLERFNYKRFEDLLAGIGCGDVSSAQLAGALQHTQPPASPAPPPAPAPRRTREARPVGGVQVNGVGNLLTQMARCCQPVPPDPIVGFITRGRGVTVHRCDCSNMLRLEGERRARLVDVSWPGTQADTYAVDIVVRAWDRQGLVRDVATVLSAERINIEAMDIRTETREQIAEIRMSVQVRDLTQLSRVLDLVSQLPNVFEARRTV